jgi:deoxyribonuclease V
MIDPAPATVDRALAEQRELARLVRLGPARPLPATVVGVDVSYRRGSDAAAAVAVAIDSATLELVDRADAVGQSSFPYVPGLLSFKELPLILAAVSRLRNRPELLVADGHGYAHPARFGLACHLGVETGIPTIGCAKTMFVGDHGPLGEERGDWTEIVDGGEVVGHALRSRAGVKPIYVSPGHLIDFDSARDIVLALCRTYRLPETTRQADHRSRRLLRDLATSTRGGASGRR